MTDKADPVVELVEEEEEEWPEAGAQNVEEAEQYQDKNQQYFRPFIHINSPRHEDGSFANDTKFQKGHHQTMGQHGGS